MLPVYVITEDVLYMKMMKFSLILDANHVLGKFILNPKGTDPVFGPLPRKEPP